MNAVVIAVVVAVGVLLLSLFIDRVLIPFRARKTVEKLLKNKTQHDPRVLEDPKYGIVVGGVDCLRITSSKGDASELRWSEVEEVHAYKRDLFTTDLICLAFRKSGTEECYEVHEEMAGYHDLLEALQRHLPVEFRVIGAVDNSHSAASQLRPNLITPNSVHNDPMKRVCPPWQARQLQAGMQGRRACMRKEEGGARS